MKRWGIRLVVAGAVIAVALAAMRTKPSLLDRATRVPGADATPSLWLSDHELIRFPSDTKKDVRGDDLTVMRAETLDTSIGQRTSLTDLSDRLGSQRDYQSHTIRLSPNGAWLAYIATDREGRYLDEGFHLSEIRGSRERTWPFSYDADYGYVDYVRQPGAPPCAAWLPDSRRWLEFARYENGKYRLRMHSLDVDFPKSRIIDVPAAVRALLGVTPDDLLVATDFDAQPGNAVKTVNLFEVGLYPNPAPLHQRRLHAPRYAQIREIALSPRGDRLAWLLYFRRVPAMMQWLSRFIPSLARNLRPQVGVGLWVSRRDGTAMREIGYQALDPKATAPPEPSDIRWTPNGKRLSFTFKNALYTVPADH